MHAKACQVSCSLKPHSSGTPSHYGNPSILFGQNCEGEKDMVHILRCNTMTTRILWSMLILVKIYENMNAFQ